LRIRAEFREEWTWVSVEGCLGVDEAKSLMVSVAAMVRRGFGNLVLDLRAVPEADEAGLRHLASKTDAKVVAGGDVERVLRAVNLVRGCEVFGDASSAAEACVKPVAVKKAVKKKGTKKAR
jgi:hypothetical protein